MSYLSLFIPAPPVDWLTMGVWNLDLGLRSHYGKGIEGKGK